MRILSIRIRIHLSGLPHLLLSLSCLVGNRNYSLVLLSKLSVAASATIFHLVP